jgi:uncharacterized protein YeeX (DUF496 family)
MKLKYNYIEDDKINKELSSDDKKMSELYNNQKNIGNFDNFNDYVDSKFGINLTIFN